MFGISINIPGVISFKFSPGVPLYFAAILLILILIPIIIAHNKYIKQVIFGIPFILMSVMVLFATIAICTSCEYHQHNNIELFPFFLPERLAIFLFLIPYLAGAWLLPRFNKIKILNTFILSFYMMCFWYYHEIREIGDSVWTMVSRTNELNMSEVLANFFFNRMMYLFGRIDLIMPVVGFMYTFTFLTIVIKWLTKELPKLSRDKFYYNERFVESSVYILFICTGMPALFFYGYIENTQTSITCLAISLYFYMNYLSSFDKKNSFKNLMAAVLFLVIAEMFHGQIMFLSPLYFIAFYLKRTRSVRMDPQDIKTVFWEMVCSSLAAIVLYAAVIFLLIKLGFYISQGNVWMGNHNSEMFVSVPIMLGKDHPVFWSNMLLFAVPYLPIFLIFSILYYSQKDFATTVVSPIRQHLTFLISGSLGYMMYLYIFHFGLPYPQDLDLTTSMSTIVVMLMIFVINLIYGYAKAEFNNGANNKLLKLSYIISLLIVVSSFVYAWSLTIRLILV